MPIFDLTFESGEQTLSLRTFQAQEGISQLFNVNVMALSPRPDVDLEAIVGKAAELRATNGVALVTARMRHWRGVVAYIEQVRVEHREASRGHSTYALAIVPKLWLTTQKRGHRIFQHKSVPEIVDAVLAEWSIEHAWTIDRGAYPKLEYKVQYGETDYEFLSRMLEEAGIAFTFPEAEQGSLLTFSDHLSSGKPHPASPIVFVDEPNESAQQEFVTEVQLLHAVRPGAYTIRDHDFRNPAFPVLGKAPPAEAPEARYEQYRYLPGASLVEGGRGGGTPVADDKSVARHEEAVAKDVATKRLHAERGGKRQVSFVTNVFGLQAGMLFAIELHQHPELNPGQRLLVTELHSEGGQNVHWSTAGKAAFAVDPYRPAMVTPKPEVKGVQSATVVGPPGEEIYTDEFGRVRVQFPWDREGKDDDNSSCWMRVSQGWAGTGFGAINIPRVGQEVLVSFLGGDPDQPIVVGRVFNGKSQVPYKLPDHKSRSTWKSDSYPNGGGFNEIMFEDAKAKELVYVQAQKNLRTLVKNDAVTTVGHDRQSLVKGDVVEETRGKQTVLVGGGQDIVIRTKRRERVEGDSDLHVTGDRVQKVDGDASLDADGEIHVKAGTAIVIEGADDLTLKGPGGFIRIDHKGVTIMGTMVDINSGGFPGIATARSKPEAAAEAKPDDVSVTGLGQ
ncbi:MAG: type VI secretion system tip protein TssI/VgrG [Minicystis sp.]